MTTVKATNVTKYDAGGSGDNCIADGYIKSVEKVWLDTYTIAAAIPTTTSIKIATIPANKKITDVVVHMPVITAPATSCTVYLKTGSNTAITSYFGALANDAGVAAQTVTFDGGTASTLRLNGVAAGGAISPLAAETDLYLLIVPGTTITAGTMKTIVRYT